MKFRVVTIVDVGDREAPAASHAGAAEAFVNTALKRWSDPETRKRAGVEVEAAEFEVVDVEEVVEHGE